MGSVKCGEIVKLNKAVSDNDYTGRNFKDIATGGKLLFKSEN